MQNDTRYQALWAEVVTAYLPYRLRKESRTIFRHPDEEWLSEEVYSDLELAELLSDALSITKRFQLSLQKAEAAFQEAAWRFCNQFYGLKREQIIEFGAVERQWCKVYNLSMANNDSEVDFAELEAKGFIVSTDGVITSRKSWIRLDLVPWWHIDNEPQSNFE